MRTIFVAATLVACSTAAFAQSSPQAFVGMAASSGLYEIRSSQMLLEADAVPDEVRAFAEQMVNDHTAAAEKLATAAKTAGLDVPSEPMSRERTKLEQLEAAEDRVAVYLAQQNTGHNAAVVLHRSYAASGTDEALRAYAEEVLPTLEEHLGHVEMIRSETAQ